jgi:two-component system NtrC family sensor kinase
MVLAFIIARFLATSILRPVRDLRQASRKLADGKLDTRVEVDPGAAEELAELAESFNSMAGSMAHHEAQLRESARKMSETKKLATLGQLAAGIAHEINNPLGGILMYSHMLLDEIDGDPEVRGNVEKIGREADRCKKIVKGLLDFARQTKPERTESNINLVLDEVVALLEQQTLFHNVEIVKDQGRSIPLVDIDVAQVQEVFMNIVLNAVDAMDGRGTLSLSTRLSSDGRYVEVELADTGPGIPEDQLDKVFEPFFTTKEVGLGTGLGLSIAYGIIERHHGRIWAESSVGKGTSFFVQLPILETTPPEM